MCIIYMDTIVAPCTIIRPDRFGLRSVLRRPRPSPSRPSTIGLYLLRNYVFAVPTVRRFPRCNPRLQQISIGDTKKKRVVCVFFNPSTSADRSRNANERN